MAMTYSGKYTLPMTMANRCKYVQNNQNHQFFPLFYSLFSSQALPVRIFHAQTPAFQGW